MMPWPLSIGCGRWYPSMISPPISKISSLCLLKCYLIRRLGVAVCRSIPLFASQTEWGRKKSSHHLYLHRHRRSIQDIVDGGRHLLSRYGIAPRERPFFRPAAESFFFFFSSSKKQALPLLAGGRVGSD